MLWGIEAPNRENKRRSASVSAHSYFISCSFIPSLYLFSPSSLIFFCFHSLSVFHVVNNENIRGIAPNRWTTIVIKRYHDNGPNWEKEKITTAANEIWANKNHTDVEPNEDDTRQREKMSEKERVRAQIHNKKKKFLAQMRKMSMKSA